MYVCARVVFCEDTTHTRAHTPDQARTGYILKARERNTILGVTTFFLNQFL